MEYKEALDNLIVGIGNSYKSWSDNKDGRKRFIESLSLKGGRKFDKVIHDGSVWGFVAKEDGVHKGLRMKAGDVLKAAGWSAPAKHTRGNIFNKNQDYFRWTGPDYR